MHPDDLRAIAVATANLVDEKIQASLVDFKEMVRLAGDAGHAAITRADQVETKLEDHETRIRKLERLRFHEDDAPMRAAGE
jgi:hypothetical protein